MSDEGVPLPAPVNGRPSVAGACATNSFAHPPGPRRDSQGSALLGAVGLKAGLFTVEILGGIAFGSLALLADATHVAFDAIALVVAVVGVAMAGRPVSSRLSFGYARAEVMAAHFSALLMLVAGSVIVVEALARLGDPVPVDGTGLVVVASLGLAFNAASATLIHRHEGHSLNMRAAFAHLATDAAGALTSLLAGVAILLWGWMAADAVASLATAALILSAGAVLLRETMHVLMESAPRGLDPGRIRAVISDVDGVLDVHHVHVWGLASDLPACSAHVVLAGRPTLGQAQRTSLTIKSRLALQLDVTNVTLEIEDTSWAADSLAGEWPGRPEVDAAAGAATTGPRHP